MNDNIEFQPEDDDAYLTSVGPLGSQTQASLAGKVLGVFTEEREAREAIREAMDREQFWPNVWVISDHGNYHLTTLESDGA